MRIYWDEEKRRLVLDKRNIDFAKLNELLLLPYVEDFRNDDPEQYRIIGFADSRLVTFIVEYRFAEQGDYLWVVTAWNSTTSEKQIYGQETR